MLVNVGRIAEALEQLRQADDMLALYVYTPLTLANALAVAGKPDEAKRFYDAAIDLAPDTAFAQRLTLAKAMRTGDTKILLDPKLPIPEEQRAALLKGYEAMASRDAGEKAHAVQTLLALPEDKQNDAVARMLADLGAEHDALQVAARFAMTHEGASLFWYPSMRGVLGDPAFPDLAKQLGLMDYWRETHTRPDVCAANEPPPFCRTI
jgi:tetratricopeptide (TPR) repeat protein